MARSHDKMIARARATQDEVGRTQNRPPVEPMTRQAIESFIAGFALSAAAQRQIVERWTADQREVRDEAYQQATWDQEGY